MNKEEALYIKIGESIKGSEKSQMFGKPCFKVNGKAFICLFQQCMVFKLTGKLHQEALSLDGSQLFDPSGKKRPMKEWVQISFDYSEKWERYANAAYDYVKSSN